MDITQGPLLGCDAVCVITVARKCGWNCMMLHQWLIKLCLY